MKQVSAGERWQLILSGDPVEISMLEVLLEGSQAEAVDEFIKDSCRSENLPLGLTGLPDEHCLFTILTYMLGLSMIEVREYVDAVGKSPFTKWLLDLNVQAAVKVAAALERITDGNLSNVEPVGAGVLEVRIDFGPGYRIYFGRDGNRLIILLAGGTKKRQQADIVKAKAYWIDYRKRR